MSEECEWNPRYDRPAQTGDASHGFAVVSVGVRENWHLCASCAELPQFSRFRRRDALSAGKDGAR